MNIPRGILSGALGAVLVAGLLYLLGWLDPNGGAPRYRDVQVDSAAIVEDEPDPDVGLLESMVRPRVEPETRATAANAAAGDVAAFCQAAGYRLATSLDRSAPGPRPPGTAGGVPPGDPLPSPTPELPTAAAMPDAAGLPGDSAALAQPHSGLPPALQPRPSPIALARSGRIGTRETDLWLVRSDGDLVRESYRVRPPVTFRLDGDSAIVQGTALWWVRPAASLASCAAGGWLSLELNSPVPLAAGCAVGFWIAVR
jgi:hypothetical protein